MATSLPTPHSYPSRDRDIERMNMVMGVGPPPPIGVPLLGAHFFCTSCSAEDWRIVEEAQLYPECWSCGRLFTDDDVESLFYA